jgi:hypothetical protein
MALDITSEENSQEYDQLYTFVESLCFYLTQPSPNSLQEQYEFVKDAPEVPTHVKESLRNPTPEARKAGRALVEEHQKLVDLLSGEQKVAVKETLDFLAEFFQRDAPDDRFNQPRRALQTTWGQFRSYS